MDQSEPNKVVYLFGAGATHAELLNVEQTATEKEEERGLLMSSVSARIIERARRDPRYLAGAEMVSGTSGSLNIELLISLFENSKIEDWEYKANHLKELVREDIEGILTASLKMQFYLHKALLEFHKQEVVERQEQLLGLISLNYDDVLDRAYQELLPGERNYSFSLDRGAPASGNENSHAGAIRDFVYREMGKEAPFLRRTGLSEKRFSRQFALAQICINSFSRAETHEFVRARFNDLEDFFKGKYDLDSDDDNLVRIRAVLEVMDECFGESAGRISSRAVAVSAYLSVEGMYLQKRVGQVPSFVTFYLKLLDEIKANLKLLSEFREADNKRILEGFQKHISQASVEPYAIKSRNLFLEEAFRYYLDPKTKGEIIGSR